MSINDFSSVQDTVIKLRPLSASDKDLYHRVRSQHSLIYRYLCMDGDDRRDRLFFEDAIGEHVFFCAIMLTETSTPIGFVGIKDTQTDLWEIAIELDDNYVRRGYGSHSLSLFLNEISRLSGRTSFQARVDADNIASQKCIEKVGGTLVGICNGVVPMTDEEKASFEGKNLNLIDDHIRSVAACIGVPPQKLLTHPLDYRFTCPMPK